jgi:hypothetical protein
MSTSRPVRRMTRRHLLAAAPDEETTTTTTAPPTRPSAGDQPLLTYAESCEKACAQLYELALDAGGFDGVQLELVTILREHHVANANALAGINGVDGAKEPTGSIIAEYERAVTNGDRDRRVQSLLELEERMVATHLSLLGVLEGTDGAARVASIVSAGSRRCVVLGQSSQASQADFLPSFERVALAFGPDEFPVVAS